VKAVRLTRANGLNERVQGDMGEIRFLEDSEAGDMVSINLAEYAPEHDNVARMLELQRTPLTVTEAESAFVGPERAAQRMQELVELTEEMGLYENQQPVYEEVNAPHPLRDLDEEIREQELLKAPAEAKMPWTTASKADWIEWAVSKGCEPKMAALLTKQQLMSRYGERL
jgi:hypothetical protein